VKMFLFGDAHDAHWQLAQGSLLAVFAAKVRSCTCAQATESRQRISKQHGLPCSQHTVGDSPHAYIAELLPGGVLQHLLRSAAVDRLVVASDRLRLPATKQQVRAEDGRASLTLAGGEQLTHVGTAADFGICKSTRKVHTCTASQGGCCQVFP